MPDAVGEKRRLPIDSSILSPSLVSLEDARLTGTRCRSCGETYLGRRIGCEYCLGRDMQGIVLSNRGTLFSYTVCRHRPPGDYKGPEPFVPFAVGLVELEEGLRILAPLADCCFDELRVGMALNLAMEPFYEDEEGNEVVAFKYRPA